MARSLKSFVRECLDAGMSVEATWKKAEAERWYAPWNYVSRIAREWQRDQANKDHN